jgi:hypothetical protein
MIAIARTICQRTGRSLFLISNWSVGYALCLFDLLKEGWTSASCFTARECIWKKHPPDYLKPFHWAVESEDSLIDEAIKRSRLSGS